MSEFEWQEDNAKPHTAVREELRKSLARGRPKGRMREQPARSPDVNVLDLVVWRSDFLGGQGFGTAPPGHKSIGAVGGRYLVVHFSAVSPSERPGIAASLAI